MCVCASVGWGGPMIRRRFGSLEVWKRFGTGLCRSPRCIDLDALCVCVYSHRQYVPVPMHKQSRAALSNKQVQADEQTSSTEGGRLWILWCKDSRAPTQTTIVTGPSQGMIRVRLDRMEWGGVDGGRWSIAMCCMGRQQAHVSKRAIAQSFQRTNQPPGPCTAFWPFPTHKLTRSALPLDCFIQIHSPTHPRRSEEPAGCDRRAGAASRRKGIGRSCDTVAVLARALLPCASIRPPSQLPPLDTRPPCCTTTSG